MSGRGEPPSPGMIWDDFSQQWEIPMTMGAWSSGDEDLTGAWGAFKQPVLESPDPSSSDPSSIESPRSARTAATKSGSSGSLSSSVDSVLSQERAIITADVTPTQDDIIRSKLMGAVMPEESAFTDERDIDLQLMWQAGVHGEELVKELVDQRIEEAADSGIILDQKETTEIALDALAAGISETRKEADVSQAETGGGSSSALPEAALPRAFARAQRNIDNLVVAGRIPTQHIAETKLAVASVLNTLFGVTPVTGIATVNALTRAWYPISRKVLEISGEQGIGADIALRAVGLGNRIVTMLSHPTAPLALIAAAGAINVISYLIGKMSSVIEVRGTVTEKLNAARLLQSITAATPIQRKGNSNQQSIATAYIAQARGAIARAEKLPKYYNVRNNRGSAVTRPLISNERVMFAGY